MCDGHYKPCLGWAKKYMLGDGCSNSKKWLEEDERYLRTTDGRLVTTGRILVPRVRFSASGYMYEACTVSLATRSTS